LVSNMKYLNDEVLNTSVWLSYILSSIFYDNPTMVKGIVQYIMDDIKNVPDVKYFFLFSALWLCSTPVCIELLEKMKTNLNIDEEEKSAISLALQNVLKSPFFFGIIPFDTRSTNIASYRVAHFAFPL